MSITRLGTRIRRTGETGSSMLEFVMMLPFIWIILVLILDFGRGFLERQRTYVALRELGIRQSFAAARGGDSSVQTIANQLTQDTLGLRRMSATFSTSEGNNISCPNRNPGTDDGGLQGVLAGMSGFMGRMSSTQLYETNAQGQPLAGRLLPQRLYEGCYAIDVHPWTYAETGGYAGFIKKMLGGL
jgi:Flp pilus assembly protein TadG